MDAAQVIASRVGPDDFVFCLGGECTLVTGTLAGFKATFKGKPGMLWLDAHGDFNTPETSTSGFLGGMPLAFACGRGPKLHQSIEDARPLLEEANVVHVASRALDPLESKAMESSPMKLYPASTLRKEGVGKVAAEAAAHLADRSDWIVCHLDVDSIDPTIIPAVNYPEPGGLTLEEVKTVVKAVQGTGKLKVFNLTAYNPTLDKDHASAQRLVTLVAGTHDPGIGWSVGSFDGYWTRRIRERWVTQKCPLEQPERNYRDLQRASCRAGKNSYVRVGGRPAS